ncbi:MAG TPA: sigma-70 family RNA polymerase sigma factor [Bacteroidia bacterium]|nr:sigma-70 family RNA polymerase sigma factor [Bacteroidia bacterium]
MGDELKNDTTFATPSERLSEFDKELLEKFRKEETRNYAFNLLVREYQKRLYWHIRKILIDHDDTNDVLQNVFIKVWRNLQGFKGESQLYTWLYRIATNESITFLNQKKRRAGVPLDEGSSFLGVSLQSDALFKGDEIQAKLQKAILTLPDKQRIVFNMKYFDNMKYEEMSRVLETSVGALKASFHHAVKKIETYLTSH